MVDPATVSAVVNVANFVIGHTVNKETDFAMLRRIEVLSRENCVLGPAIMGRIQADSPMIECLKETAAGKGENACPAGIAYVFYERRSLGKSRAARFFCRKICNQVKCRSLLIPASTAGETYFQRVAADLGVDYTSNWARCLLSAMTKSPKEKFNPFLFLDEFNEGTKRDLQDMNTFMRACQDLGFYLIIITSEETIADDVMKLNAWGKMRPLKCIHNGPITNIIGQPGYNANKKADWKRIDWTFDQLKSLVIMKEGEFDDFGFIVAGMTPTDALFAAKELKNQREDDFGAFAAV
jgi:hypothetical protein